MASAASEALNFVVAPICLALADSSSISLLLAPETALTLDMPASNEEPTSTAYFAASIAASASFFMPSTARSTAAALIMLFKPTSTSPVLLAASSASSAKSSSSPPASSVAFSSSSIASAFSLTARSALVTSVVASFKRLCQSSARFPADSYDRSALSTASAALATTRSCSSSSSSVASPDAFIFSSFSFASARLPLYSSSFLPISSYFCLDFSNSCLIASCLDFAAPRTLFKASCFFCNASRLFFCPAVWVSTNFRADFMLFSDFVQAVTAFLNCCSPSRAITAPIFLAIPSRSLIG